MFKNLIGRIVVTIAVSGLILTGSPSLSTAAGITVFKDGDKFVKMGGRIQLQYHQKDPEVGESTDEVFFRRFRPYIEGSLHKDWTGKFQWDMGKAEDGNELAVKDAYLQYKGFKHAKLTVGNAKVMFSRESLTSSKKQQLVERTFVGDHNYGTPDRNLGIHATGGFLDGHKVTYGLSFASASIDPDAKKLDFDTPVNKNNDFNEGWIVGGRIDFHPFGQLKMSQGDFKQDLKATIGVAGFSWDNDDDNNTRTTNGVDDGAGKPDVDSVTGFEISAALRVKGLSIDAEYNRFNADTVDSTVTKGIFKSGSTDLENFAVEAGYMVIPSRMEVVAGYESQDADGYLDEWTRTSVGLNYFFVKKHDIKLQGTYRIGEDVDGVPGKDLDEVFVQMQYVF